MQELYVAKLLDWPIFDQLCLEEALLRTDQRNWCVINQGSPPAIVMGISGKADQLVHAEAPLPLIRRFSGGGTVVVDQGTLFFTLICNHTALVVEPYPEPILHWMAALYAPLFQAGFALSENDFTLFGKKFAGHAQYLAKERWLHHTSLLHDYRTENMAYLLMPEKQPKYRQNRAHDDFVCRLKDFMPDPAALFDGLLEQLASHFTVIAAPQTYLQEILERECRTATKQVPFGQHRPEKPTAAYTTES